MDARINYFGNALAGKVMKHLNSAGAAVHGPFRSPLRSW